MATNESVWSLGGLLSAKETLAVDDGRWKEGAMVYLNCFCWRGSTGTGPDGSSALVLGHIPICHWDLKCVGVGEVGR